MSYIFIYVKNTQYCVDLVERIFTRVSFLIMQYYHARSFNYDMTKNTDILNNSTKKS